MRGVGVSVESIRWPLIYVIVVEHVAQHDLIFRQRIRYVNKNRIFSDLFLVNKCAAVLLLFILNFTLEVATGGFPYGGGKCELITKTMTFQ